MHPGEAHLIVPVVLLFPDRYKCIGQTSMPREPGVSVFLAGSHLAAFQPFPAPLCEFPAVHEQSRGVAGCPSAIGRVLT